MNFYANKTRHSAILTLNIESIADNANAFIKIGSIGAFEESKIPKVGYYDFLVAPGKELQVAEGLLAMLFAVRSAH